MPVREGPLKPMTTSGHCRWPTANFGHSSCAGMKLCTCPCHTDPTFDTTKIYTGGTIPPVQPETSAPTPKLQLKKRRAK